MGEKAFGKVESLYFLLQTSLLLYALVEERSNIFVGNHLRFLAYLFSTRKNEKGHRSRAVKQ